MRGHHNNPRLAGHERVQELVHQQPVAQCDDCKLLLVPLLGLLVGLPSNACMAQGSIVLTTSQSGQSGPMCLVSEEQDASCGSRKGKLEMGHLHQVSTVTHATVH